MSLLNSLFTVLASASAAEAAGVILAIAYLLFAIRQNILCWFAALASSLIYLWVFFGARLYMESVLQIFYAAMALYGWYEWRFGGANHEGLRIVTWRPLLHVIAIAGIATATVLVGWLLSSTGAALPYLDSFTSVAAVVTTFMVARKVLENWIYWFVIDGVSIYLYVSRELYLTAGLFLFYLVLIVVGFRTWWRDWQAETAEAA